MAEALLDYSVRRVLFIKVAGGGAGSDDEKQKLIQSWHRNQVLASTERALGWGFFVFATLTQFGFYPCVRLCPGLSLWIHIHKLVYNRICLNSRSRRWDDSNSLFVVVHPSDLVNFLEGRQDGSLPVDGGLYNPIPHSSERDAYYEALAQDKEVELIPPPAQEMVMVWTLLRDRPGASSRVYPMGRLDEGASLGFTPLQEELPPP